MRSMCTHTHTHTRWLNYAMKVLNATDADSGKRLAFDEFTVIPELFLPSSVQTRTWPWRISPQTTCRFLLPSWPSPQPAKYKQPDKWLSSVYIFTQRPFVFFPLFKWRISGGNRLTSESKKRLGFEFRRRVEPQGAPSCLITTPWLCGCAYVQNVTPHLVHISLGGPLFAEALLLHCFSVVVLLGFLQGLSGGLDVLHCLQRRCHLFFCLWKHTHTHTQIAFYSNSANNSMLNNKCKYRSLLSPGADSSASCG